MRVHFDDQIVMHQPRGGMSRYFVELVDAFRHDPELGVTADVDWRASRNVHAVEAGLGRPASRTRRRLNRVTRRLPSLPRRWPDIDHPTYYYPARLPARGGPPMVVTVVDMIPELLPDFYSAGNPHLAKESYVRQADAIVCISESTRRDMLQVYGPLEAVVEVVHLAVSAHFRPGVLSAKALPDEYILFVGNRANYKDFTVATEAFAGLRAEHPGLSLVAVGGKFSGTELEDLRRLSIEDAVQRVAATDAELPAIFGGARAFVFPSRYEGFGLPTLEAMACGTAVVLADSSSHPEVGGDAALYFPPGDASALGTQIHRLLGDDDLRQSLISRGLERARTFTWHRTATQTRDVYARVARP